MKIRYNLFIFIILFGIIFSLLPAYFFITMFVDSQKDEIVNDLETTASVLLDRISSFMNERIANFEVISSPTHMLSNPSSTIEQKVDFLRLLEKSTKAYRSMSIYDKNGIKIGDTRNILVGIDESEKSFFKKALQGKLYYDKSPVLSQSLQTYVIHISAPLYENGHVSGVVVGRIPVSKINQMIQQSNIAGKNTDVDIWTKDGHKIYSNYDLKIDQNDIAGDQPMLKKIIDSTQYVESIVPKSSENSIVSVGVKEHNFLNYAGSDIYLTINMSENELFGKLTSIEQQLFAISTLLISIAIIVIFFYTKIITKTIEKLKKTAVEISKGNFDIYMDIKNRNELEELANAFNLMIISLRNYRNLVSEKEKTITNQLQEIIQKSNELQLINCVLDETSSVSITDPTGRLIYVNEKFCNLSKYDRNELIGKNHKILKSGFHNSAFYKDMWNTIQNGKIWIGVIKNKAKDGTYYWLKTTIVPDIKDGKIVRFVSIRNDITAQKENEEQLQELLLDLSQKDKLIQSQLAILKEKDKQKDEFIAMVSHELKTPLVPIRAYCDILLDPSMVEKLQPDQLESIKEISNNTDLLQRLVESILLVQKIEFKQLKLQKEEFDVNSFINQMIKSHITVSLEKQIKFVNSTQKRILMNCDKGKLAQVLGNLIQNAVDFVLPSGSIEIGAKDEGERVLFFIKDDGVGIPKDKQASLFKRFYQVDSSLKRKHGGTGLGLSICKGIVELMGGEIWVESNEGKGTTFYFFIPKDKITLKLESSSDVEKK